MIFGAQAHCSGSFGDQELSVESIPQVSTNADKTACNVVLELRQSNFSLDVTKHIKNKFNAVKFEWQVPGSVYTNLNVGDDLIKDGFRSGSFVLKGSVGSWHLKVVEKKGPVHP